MLIGYAPRVFADLGLDPAKFGLDANDDAAVPDNSSWTKTTAQPGAKQAPTGPTERTTTTAVRRGQSFFRAAVLSNYNSACAVSGITHPELLVASHIVPWSDSTDARLDPGNGLALSALHDKAFDRGLITITPELRIEVSSEIRHDEEAFERAAIWRFHGRELASPHKFPPRDTFLAHHREHIFRP